MFVCVGVVLSIVCILSVCRSVFIGGGVCSTWGGAGWYRGDVGGSVVTIGCFKKGNRD